MCWGPPGDTVPKLLLPVDVGSGFSFLKAPSAIITNLKSQIAARFQVLKIENEAA